MGKKSDGIVLIKEALSLDLKFLQKEGYIQPGEALRGVVCWNRQDNSVFKADIVSNHQQFEKWVLLIYTYNGKSYTQKIEIVTKPSNLGSGEIMYFVCPAGGNQCKSLYLAYGIPVFISRVSYYELLKKRLYYDGQACSKRKRAETRYWNVHQQLTDDETMRRAFNYAGKPTKRKLKVEQLTEQLEELDEIKNVHDLKRYLPDLYSAFVVG